MPSCVGTCTRANRSGEEARLLGEVGDVAQGDGGAGDAADRHQQGDGVEQRQPGAIPGPQAPGEVQADAGMQPDDEGQRELPHDAGPVAGHQRAQHPGIAGLDAVELVRQPGADDMSGAQRDDQRAQDPLRPFPGRQLQRAPPVERPQGEEEMAEQRAVEHGLADRIVPDEDEPVPARLEHAQRDQAERVVQQMRDDIEEQHIARPEAEPADHGAISAAAAPLPAAGRWRRACPRPRSAAAAGRDGRRSPSRCRRG